MSEEGLEIPEERHAAGMLGQWVAIFTAILAAAGAVVRVRGRPPDERGTWVRGVRPFCVICASLFLGWVLWHQIQVTPQSAEAGDSARIREVALLRTGQQACGIPSDAYAWGPLGYSMRGNLGTTYLLLLSLSLPLWASIASFVLLWATALQRSALLWWPSIIMGGLACAWQPGITAWATSAWSSWVFTTTNLILVGTIWTRRLRWQLLMGFCAYWLSYTPHLQAAAIVSGFLASQRSIWRAGLALVAFGCGAILTLLVQAWQLICSGYTQPTIWGDLHFRFGGTWAQRWEMLPRLVRDYAAAVQTPLWSTWWFVEGTTVALGLTGLLWIWLQARYGLAWTALGSRLGRVVLIVFACALCTPVFMFAAPAFWAPHLHLFPGLILGPFIVMWMTVPMVGQ